MKKVLIIGAGPGGCSAAIAFAQIGWQVTVLEKLPAVTTRGAGILLYSNGLKSLDGLSVLDQILDFGAPRDGGHLFYDSDANVIGSAKFHPIDDRYPSYCGIDRRKFLDILYEKARSLSVDFHFSCRVDKCVQEGHRVSVVCEDNRVYQDYDLLIAADGLNSIIRRTFWDNSQSVYSGFGLYHSTHDLHPEIKDKIAVIMPGKRFGMIPMSNDKMYIWASLSQPQKMYIKIEDQPKTMHDEFNDAKGFLKDVIDDLINKDTYVHYTSVEEVNINEKWHNDRVVLLGDASHAATPHMAQGGSMALTDAVVLSKWLASNRDIDESLTEYANIRKPAVKVVQRMSKNMGLSYAGSTIDTDLMQQNMDSFYLNKSYFNYY